MYVTIQTRSSKYIDTNGTMVLLTASVLGQVLAYFILLANYQWCVGNMLVNSWPTSYWLPKMEATVLPDSQHLGWVVQSWVKLTQG